jgi:pyruvate/2-oxoglutarate/acetoin dehydrogenase E1 component
MCRVISDAAQFLSEIFGIEVEIVDVRTLLPFDVNHLIKESIRKTNRMILADEDVPGGATGFMMKQILEDQGGYFLLDSQPVTIAAKEHRPAYGSDGDYYSKPNAEDVIEAVLALMKEAQPARFA